MYNRVGKLNRGAKQLIPGNLTRVMASGFGSASFPIDNQPPTPPTSRAFNHQNFLDSIDSVSFEETTA